MATESVMASEDGNNIHGPLSPVNDGSYNVVELEDLYFAFSDEGSNSANNSDGASLDDSMKVEVETPNGLDFATLYRAISLHEPYLMVNFPVWNRNENGQKCICSLCNTTVKINENLTIFKASILVHLNTIHHREMFTAAWGTTCVKDMAELQAIEVRKMICISSYEESSKRDIYMTGEINHPNGKDAAGINAREHDAIFSYMCGQELSTGKPGVQPIHDSLNTGSSVIMPSKKYICKNAFDEHFMCTLCDMLILFSPNPNELRYNIWSHIHEDSHISKLPGRAEVEKEFNKHKKELLQVIRNDENDEERFFDVGPNPYLVKCNVCTSAVSTNVHHWANHICGQSHIDMKDPIFFQQKLKWVRLSSRIAYQFDQLMSQIDSAFNKYKHGIQAGLLPGYVVCVNCCCMVLSKKSYLESHFRLNSHVNHCLLRPVIPVKITVRDLVHKLPAELKGNVCFDQIPCGLRCKVCDFLCPATAYDMYAHIVKHKHETQ